MLPEHNKIAAGRVQRHPVRPQVPIRGDQWRFAIAAVR